MKQHEPLRKRLIICPQDKGGIGKSFVMTLIYDYLTERSVKLKTFDLDHANNSVLVLLLKPLTSQQFRLIVAMAVIAAIYLIPSYLVPQIIRPFSRARHQPAPIDQSKNDCETEFSLNLECLGPWPAHGLFSGMATAADPSFRPHFGHGRKRPGHQRDMDEHELFEPGQQLGNRS